MHNEQVSGSPALEFRALLFLLTEVFNRAGLLICRWKSSL
jgi:hypothetical protein